MSKFNYTQLPPDGTGKRISAVNTQEYGFTYIGGDTFSIGDNVLNATRGLDGNIVGIYGNEIYVVLNRILISPLQNGDILTVDGVDVATFNELKEDMRTQTVSIVGHNSTLNGVSVNEQGAMITSFASGDPLFDAFGKLMTSETTTIREYQPVSGKMDDEFTETTTLGCTIAWIPTERVIRLTNPSGNTGAISRRRSNLYHKYQTGVATTVVFSGYMNGVVEGVTRRVGLFDDDDGLFFYADGNIATGLGVVVRSSVTGSVVENVVQQADWNVDRMDGQGGALNISNVLLDPTKTQVMFIDYQWLGAGRVRFGFVIDGEYIICHQFNHANKASRPYMRTGTLPFTIEQENTGVPASTSEFNIISAAVKCEGKFEPREWVQGGVNPEQVVANDDTTFQQVLSFRAAQTLDGVDNRSVSLPQFIHITDVSGTDKPFIVEIVKNDTHAGTGVWSDPYPGNALESASPDYPASGNITSTTGGEVLVTDVVIGRTKIDMTGLFDLQSQIIIRKADITLDPDHYTIRVRPVINGDSVTVLAGMTWKEYR